MSTAPPVTFPQSAERPAVPPILEEHLEEQAFLWIQRRRLLFSPDVPARRLPAHDERIAAHWDALVIGGAASVAVAETRLEDENPWIAASALRCWLELARPDGPTAFARLETMPPEFAPAWREALRWVDEATVDRLFPAARVSALPPAPQALAIEARAAHEKLDAALAQQAARHADPIVRGAIARVLAWPGTGGFAPPLLGALTADADPAVRRRARWSAGLRDAAGWCARLRSARVTELEPFDARTLGWLGEEPEDSRVLATWAEHDPLREASLLALGDLGDTDAIETLLRVLAVPDDAVKLAATAGLERALGPLAGEEGDEPKVAPADLPRAKWRTLSESLPRGARLWRGKARPWSGEAREEPMGWTWRGALLRPKPETREFSRHVPDGFWAARESIVAEPGT